MKRICLWIVLLAVAVVASGCQTHSGSREFIPGQGWKHTD
jgi:predicted small secreted protein